MSIHETRGRRASPKQRDASVLIGQIYDAVEDFEALPEVLSVLCERIGGRSAMLGILMKIPGPMPLPVSFRLDPAVMETLYARHLDNVWRQHIDTLPVGIPAASDSFVPLEHVRRTDFYGEVLEPWSIGHSAWFSIDDTRKHRVAMSINRSLARGPFTSEELRASLEILPHLKRAMQLRSLLERHREEQKLALGVLDQLASGVLIVDNSMHVIFANIVAEEIIGPRDVLVMADGTIRPRQRELGDTFRRLLESAIAGLPGGSLLLRRPTPRLPVSALVTPLAGTLAVSLADRGRIGAAAVFLADPERQEISAGHFRALYKLSPTEARVAWLASRSGGIGSAAKALGIAPETVRTHLKHIYAKTGVNRQSALAHLLATAAVARTQ